MWTSILTFALQVASYFLGKNADDKEMQELFYKFVERQQAEYLKSQKAREMAQKRLKAIMDKPFVETP
ncbi:MAG: hypothetical protein E6R04_10225 [Spirochaetes bacterium]|nr:MAG: hypothetical protein E6R04_10225 [Spirochaetota bacterium]